MDYESKRWKRKRRYILRLDGYKDRVAARFGKNLAKIVEKHLAAAHRCFGVCHCFGK